MRVCTVTRMREMDRMAQARYGIAPNILMENAGLAAVSVLMERFGDLTDTRIGVVCGLGNNGGDGLVIARKCFSLGAQVTIWLLADPGKYKGAAAEKYAIVEKMGIECRRITDDTPLDATQWASCDCVVDAIFGTGISRPVEGRFARTVETINAADVYVLGVDIPSGIHGDTGMPMGPYIRARRTVTFGLPKIGMLRYPAFDACGSIDVTHISFPPALYEDAAVRVELPDTYATPLRQADAHKGSVGRVLTVAGAAAYYGAPFLAAMAVLRTGGGYSMLAAVPDVIHVTARKAPELVFSPQQATPQGAIARDNEERILELARRMEAVVLGPGLSLDAQPQQLVRALVERIPVPLVLDGDGLTAVSNDASVVSNRSAPTVLTPHVGEMARLSGTSSEEILQEPYTVLRDTAARYNAVIALKGAHSLIGTPQGDITINLSGNHGMATAGAGDVLAGAIAALIAAGLPAEQATPTAVYIHGDAGDRAAADIGVEGLTARDILARMPHALQGLHMQNEPIWQRYGIRRIL